MKLYSKQGEQTTFFVGSGITSTTAKIVHRQKSSTNGSKRTRIEDKKEHVFNIATKFEAKDKRKNERKMKREFSRNRGTGEKRF
jgi:hypothetical protein